MKRHSSVVDLGEAILLIAAVFWGSGEIPLPSIV